LQEAEQSGARPESVVGQADHPVAIAPEFATGGDLVLAPNREGLESALQHLDSAKLNYLNNVGREVESYIRGQSIQRCLGIVETVNLNGQHVSDNYSFSRTHSWFVRFTAFTAGRDPTRPPQYQGRPLDSFLTAPVKDKVVDTTLQFYREHQGYLVECVVHTLVGIPAFQGAILRQVQLRLSTFPPPISPREQARLAPIVTNDILTSVTASVFAIDESSAKNHVAVAKGAIRVTLARCIAEIVRNYLAKPEFRQQIEGLVSSAVVSTIIVTIITALASLGVISIFSVSSWWLIAPAVVGAAWVTYEAVNIPADLGRKVSAAIQERLDENFRPYNEKILSNIFEDTIRNKLDQIGSALMENDYVDQSIRMRREETAVN